MSFARNIFLAIQVMILLNSQSLLAHCQIPCGIYNDQMRFQMIEEHITTIEKSMKQVVELSKASPVNYNQLVRWISNKEEHAQQIQDIVHAYFLTQRVKPVDRGDAEAYKKYTHKVVLLHQLLFYAMKTTQTTDLSIVEKLRQLLSEFHNVYVGKQAKEHLKKEHR
jgi:nickel superoxide dismutase